MGKINAIGNAANTIMEVIVGAFTIIAGLVLVVIVAVIGFWPLWVGLAALKYLFG